MNPTRTSSSRVLAVVVVVLAVVAMLWYAGRRGTAEPSPSAVGTSSSTGTHDASAEPTPDSGLPTIAATDLPKVAQSMLVTIHDGGPFRYKEDGQTFANRERILPKQAATYYKEYTVKSGTQGDRGPLRIIGGRSGDLYWTSDHYAHFQQIKEGNR